jgi:hypothetical protein
MIHDVDMCTEGQIETVYSKPQALMTSMAAGWSGQTDHRNKAQSLSASRATGSALISASVNVS